MYIEFALPTGAGGMAAQYANNLLNQELHAWSDLYDIPYNTKLVKYTKRVTFDNEETYSFFAMTWNPKNKKFRNNLLNYRLIEPMNRV
jgi:hypothetical protein